MYDLYPEKLNEKTVLYCIGYRCFNGHQPLLLCLPLFTYLSGFIDKKHFYTLAAIIFTSSILAFALFLSLDFDSETYEYAALQSLNPHPCI